MEDQQKARTEEEEAIIIATADTQLITETTASMEAEESLELHQDDSVRDPSFNEGNFMSHNLLTSASTPICPASAMKRLLHLSNDSSEDNRTPPKKLRTDLISKVAVQEVIQDDGSARSQDSWKSHDDRRHQHHPADALLKGGSFCQDNGAGDAHRKGDSFSADDEAAAASSYDSHQGHIYRAGMSSDRLLDMRKSPTKEQLVHMIENLNSKIAKYENERDVDVVCPSRHKNELLENTGKKLTFTYNAICVVEMKDENRANIRCISLCEEAHLMPANTYCNNEQQGGSFQHNGSGSDADRSCSLTTGGSSQLSGPGPYEVPPLTQVTRMAHHLAHHDSLTSSSSSSNGGAGGRIHQGTSNLGQRHVKLPYDKLAHHLRLTCPRCEYTFGRPQQSPPAAANHSRFSSNAASPLVVAHDQSQLRDISNLVVTPPTASKISVLDCAAVKQPSKNQSRPQLLKRSHTIDTDAILNSPAGDRHIGSANDDILRPTPELIKPQNKTTLAITADPSESVPIKSKSADPPSSGTVIQTPMLQSQTKDSPMMPRNEPTTAKERTMASSRPTSAKESNLTPSRPTTAKESTPILPTAAKESIMTPSGPTSAKESSLTSSRPTSAKESTLTLSRPTAAKENTLTSSRPTSAKESTLTSSRPTTAKESTLTSSRPTSAKESTLTSSRPTTAKESTLTSSRPTSAKESTLTSSRPTSVEESTLTSSRPTSAKESTLTSSRPTTAKESTLTSSRPTSVKESTLTSSRPTSAKESTSTSSIPTTAKESTLTSSRPTPAKESTLTSSRPTSAKESTLTSSRPTSVKESTLTSSRPTSVKESTLKSSRPTSAKESTSTSSRPTTAKESTLTFSRPTSAKESTLTSSRPTSAKESTLTPSRPTAAKESTMTPTTSWGETSIGTPFLCLDTSSMSSDSDPESSHFSSILDEPEIESPFLDVEARHLSRLETETSAGDDDDDDDRDVISTLKSRVGNELHRQLNKSRKTPLSQRRQIQLEMELIESGPIPEAGSDLFKGCAVVFSQCKRHIDVWRTLRSTDTEDSDKEFLTPDKDQRMDVPRLTRQVLAGGGEVYRRLHQVPKHMRDNLYLISDRPSRSPLYLSCILLRVPLVSYKAIIVACIDKTTRFKQLVDENQFTLPFGWSDETGQSVRSPEKQRPLVGISVAYGCDPSTGNHVTHRFWREILARMGARVLDVLAGENPPQHVQIVVVGDGSGAHAQNNVPAVNCNWIVHTLMHASFRQPDASQFYSVDFYSDVCNL